MTTQEQQELEKKALEQFMSGKSLFGKDGAFAPMLKSFIEKALESEMEVLLDNYECLQISQSRVSSLLRLEC